MTERQHYMRHIKRLRAENAVLRAMVVNERLAQQQAYGWYYRKLRSRWMWLTDFWLMLIREAK